jgi:hypothetical protein
VAIESGEKNGGGVRNRFGAFGVSERSTHSFPRCGYVGYILLFFTISFFFSCLSPTKLWIGFWGTLGFGFGKSDLFLFYFARVFSCFGYEGRIKKVFLCFRGGGVVVGLCCCCVATEEAKQRLSKAGFVQISERHPWNVEAGGKYFFTRNHSTIIAFAIGNKCASNPCLLLFFLVTSHTHIHFLAKLLQEITESSVHPSSSHMDPTIALLKTPHHYAKWIDLFVNNASSTFTSAAKSLSLCGGSSWLFADHQVCLFCRYTTGNGFLIIGAHTDSPCPKLKPVSKVLPFFSLLNFYRLYTYKSVLLGADEVVSGKSLINGRS